jgi:hypothetical protein
MKMEPEAAGQERRKDVGRCEPGSLRANGARRIWRALLTDACGLHRSSA